MSPDGSALPVWYVKGCEDVADEAESRTLGCKITMMLTSHPRWPELLAGLAAVQVATLVEMQPEHGLEPVGLALATCAAES